MFALPTSGAVETLIADAQLAERDGRRDDARGLYERALRTLGPEGAPARVSALLRWMGRTHQVDANFPAALDCLEAALAVATISGEDAAVGHAINLQAIVHWQLGALDEAETLYVTARAHAERAGDARLAAMISQNLGVIADVRGDRDAARKHFETSLAQYRAIGLPADLQVALNNLGKQHTESGRWAEAGAAYAEAVQIAEALGDRSTRIMLDVNLAELWIAQGEYARARAACDAASELAAQLQDTHASGEIERAYGVIARELGEFAAAEARFGRAEEIARERRDKLLEADVVRDRADLHARQGRNRDVLHCLNRAHRLFSELHAERALADVDRRSRELEAHFLDVVRQWGDSIESKDRYTQGHSERVADVACTIAAAVGFDERTLFWFRVGALLHDVGKLVVPEEVLNKPGKLTPDEWAMIKRHPSAGVEMLADIDFPWDVLPMVESHHERWDGGGYPHGTAGAATPLAARILCIADVCDALTSARSYKRALTHAEAVAAMTAESGRQFDPDLFRLFLSAVDAQAAPACAAAPGSAPAAAPAPARTTLDEAFDAIHWPAHHVDDLTGLPLRRAFVERAGEEIAGAGAADASVALLVIDVDHFKLVNDSFGHLQGDEVLRLVAAMLRTAARARDLVARYAGDEFVVLLPGVALDAAHAFAEELCAQARSIRCPRQDGSSDSVRVTLSIGCAAAPRHGDTVETLFAAADRALYAAKRRGRDGAALAGAACDDAAQTRPNLDRFVGRVAELRRLVLLLEAAAGGAPRVATLVGEAGVGKTALLRQLAPEARLRGGTLVLGRALEGDVRPPYAPWADVLAALHQQGLVTGREWQELPRLVPELDAARATLADAGAAPAAGGGKYAILDEVTEYLRLAAERRPIVVVLDDMQWADAASWDALEYALARLQEGRVMFCLTMRGEDTRAEAAARRQRLSRDERVHDFKLARLTRAEVGEWVEGAIRAGDAARALTAFLYRQTEGNAFFLLQVMRTLVDEGAVRRNGETWEFEVRDEHAVPAAVSDLIARRLDRLSPESRRALVTAAAIGREFDVDLAIAAGAGTEDELLDAIDEGVTAAVLEPAGERAGDRYAFAHTLLVDAVRASENPRRLRRAHERVADALRAHRPDAAAEIARHYEIAGRAAETYEFATLAGARAAAVYAQAEAASFYAMAVRHAGSERESVDARVRLLHASEAAGRYADAEVQCDALLGVHGSALECGEMLSVSRARERLRSLQGSPLRDTLAACHALLAIAEQEELESERAALYIMISLAHSRLGDVAQATELARAAVAIAEAVGELPLIADALARLALMVVDTSPPEAVSLYERALAIFTTLGDCHGQGRCHVNRGLAHKRAGDLAAAEAAFRVAIDLARSAHTPEIATAALLNLGVLCVRARRDVEAEACFDEALQLATLSRLGVHRLVALYNLADLARERGTFESALALYGTAASDALYFGQLDIELGAVAGAGLTALRAGRPEVAAAAMDRINDALTSRGEWWFQGREMIEALRVRLILLGGDAVGGAVAYHDAVALAESHDRYAAGWLVAETAGALADAGVAEHWAVVERYAAEADRAGFTRLATHYRDVLTTRAGVLTPA